jgi:hypothetical protein
MLRPRKINKTVPNNEQSRQNGLCGMPLNTTNLLAHFHQLPSTRHRPLALNLLAVYGATAAAPALSLTRVLRVLATICPNSGPRTINPCGLCAVQMIVEAACLSAT